VPALFLGTAQAEGRLPAPRLCGCLGETQLRSAVSALAVLLLCER